MCYNKNATINCNGALGRFPLRTVAFRGHGFSLLEKPTLRGLQTRAGTAITRPTENLCSRRSQRSSAPNNHRDSEIELYSTVAKYYVSEGNTRRLLEKENRFFCVRCFSKKLFLSCGKAKTMRPHSERSLRVRRLIASPRKA